ncbi:purine-nucleoside phosphorylase [soil metagenome]
MNDGNALAQLQEAVAHVRWQVAVQPQIGLILGTGLGQLAEAIELQAELPCEGIPHMPASTVPSHAGRLLFGTLAGRQVVAMQGRYHFYEGYSLQQVTLPVRLLHALGARTLLLSGACGGLNPLWAAGDMVLLSDHINLMGDNPLAGPNIDELGPRFPDMSGAYDPGLQELAMQTALEQRVPLRRGVYAAVAGPNLETRAEYRMLRALGADVVGMSTVPEVIVARHMGMRVLGISIVTDVCLPDALEPTDIETIIRVAAQAEPVLARLLMAIIAGHEPGSLTAAAAAGGEAR